MISLIQHLFALIAIGVFLSNAYQGADILIAFSRGALVFASLLIGSRFCMVVYRIIIHSHSKVDKGASHTEPDKTQTA